MKYKIPCILYVYSHVTSNANIQLLLFSSLLPLFLSPTLFTTMSFSTISRSLRVAGSLNSRTTFKLSTTTLPYRSITTTIPRYQNNSSVPTPNPTPTSPSTTSSAADRATQISSQNPTHQTTPNISKTGLSDKPLELDASPEEKVDWTRSFHGLSAAPFPKEVADILLSETDPEEVEIKPDGIVYLPEIKYRRILNKAFGPGAWGLVPRSESIVTPKTVTREYALVCNGRCVPLQSKMWTMCMC